MDRRKFFGSIAALLGVGYGLKSVSVKEDEWRWHEAGYEYDPDTKSWTYYSRVFDAPLPNTLMVKR